MAVRIPTDHGELYFATPKQPIGGGSGGGSVKTKEATYLYTATYVDGTNLMQFRGSGEVFLLPNGTKIEFTTTNSVKISNPNSSKFPSPLSMPNPDTSVNPIVMLTRFPEDLTALTTEWDVISYRENPGSSSSPYNSFMLSEVSTYTYFFDDLPQGYSISFQTNGGTPVSTLENQTNLPDPLPTTTREGFIFTGWYTESSLIFPAIPGAAITEDTTLYAGWRPAEFTITFNTNGGEPIGQLTKQSHLPDPLPIPIKVGNAFVGWFKDSAFLTPAIPGSPISQDTTLYAKWEEIRSTDIHVPAVNTPSLLQTGFVTMWQPTLEEVRALSSFLWTTNIFDNLRKLFNDPMEALIFLGVIPFDPTTSERGNIYFGNLDSEVESTPIVQQYYTFDFGDINLSEYYSSFLDYAPNTYAEIFLPFCGTHRLSINEIMGATINVKYNVDVFTGTCLAMLTVTKPGLDSVMYSFEGNLMATIPVTAKNYSDLYRRTITGIASIAATAVLGGVI